MIQKTPAETFPAAKNPQSAPASPDQFVTQQHPSHSSQQERSPRKEDHPFFKAGAASAAPAGKAHRRCHSTPSKGSIPLLAETPKRDALNDLELSLLASKEKYGEFHPQVGLGYNLIGNHYFRQGDLSAAADSYNSALKCFEKSDCEKGLSGDTNTSTGANHMLDVAVALGNIGAVLWRTGKLYEAIRSLEKCIKMRELVSHIKGKSTKDCVELANAFYSLGLARSLHCDYEEAIRALTHAEDTLIGVYGESHIEVARIEDAKGKCFLMQGHSDKAMEYHHKALKKKIDVLGPINSSVLSTRMNVAAAHRVRQELDEAATVYREVLNVQKLSLQREIHPHKRKQLTDDIGLTMRMLREVQREKNRSLDSMGSIIEEKKEHWEADWGAEDGRDEFQSQAETFSNYDCF